MLKKVLIPLFIGITIGFFLFYTLLGKSEFKFDEAVLVGICALCLTIWQGYLARKHNYLSLKPAVSEGAYYNTNQFTLKLKNKGHGTATISNFQFYADDNPVSFKVFQEDVYEITKKYGKCIITIHWLETGQFLAPSEEFIVLDIRYENDVDEEFYKKVPNRYGLEVEYHCPYNNKFEIKALSQKRKARDNSSKNSTRI